MGMKLFIYNNFDFYTICVHTAKIISRSTQRLFPARQNCFALPWGIAEKALGSEEHSLEPLCSRTAYIGDAAVTYVWCGGPWWGQRIPFYPLLGTQKLVPVCVHLVGIWESRRILQCYDLSHTPTTLAFLSENRFLTVFSLFPTLSFL